MAVGPAAALMTEKGTRTLLHRFVATIDARRRRPSDVLRAEAIDQPERPPTAGDTTKEQPPK